MTKTKSMDKFSNRAFVSVTESGANTLTFNQLHFGSALNEKMAIVISQVKWLLPPASRQLLVAQDDEIKAALTRSDGITSLAWNQPAMIEDRIWNLETHGTPANAFTYPEIERDDFSMFPGGGIITPADPFYLAIQGTSLASAATIYAWIYFTWLQLSKEDYWDLVEAYRVIT